MDFLKIHNDDLIKSLNNSASNISAQFTLLEDKIADLEKENAHLKSEQYKDTELQKMSEELEDAKYKLACGFGITKEELEAIQAWRVSHIEKYHREVELTLCNPVGGAFEYVFTPTGIGVIGEIKCNFCGDSFTFRKL